MKRQRLDQILFQLGFVDEEQIKKALLRQKTVAGKLGSHLLYYNFLTTDQLANALAIQFGIEAYDPENHTISQDVVKQFPIEIAEKHMVLPMDFDETEKTLSLIVVDPEDQMAITRAKRVYSCPNAKLFITAESLMEKLISKQYGLIGSDEEISHIIELPELFASDQAEHIDHPVRKTEARKAESDRKYALMISRAAFLRNALCPIFEREGVNLDIESDKYEISGILQGSEPDHLLLSSDMSEEFYSWISRGTIPLPSVEISEFSSVSGTLLDNPVGYGTMIKSLMESINIIADIRNSGRTWIPAYDLVCREIRSLGKTVGLKRIAIDGLQLAALLLVPPKEFFIDEKGAGKNGKNSFVDDFDATLEYAGTLQFPWDIFGVLNAFHELLTEGSKLEKQDVANKEIALAAQILAITWYYHVTSSGTNNGSNESTLRVKTALRAKTGILASSEIIEAYIRLIGSKDSELHTASYHQFFIIGNNPLVSNQFSSKLKRVGYKALVIEGMNEAVLMYNRQAPTAVMVHIENNSSDLHRYKEIFKRDTSVLLFAITPENNPSQTLNLLDAGFDDVFAPPHDFDIILARLGKELRFKAKDEAAEDEPEGFNASFKALSFIDLLQTLGQSMKSVHIDLDAETGEKAEIYMKSGRLIHAKCGKLSGVEAVYHVIAWGEDGSFAVTPVDDYPDENVSMSIEGILMEGCRRLDETKSGSCTEPV